MTDSKRIYDVIVVGAGVIGLYTSYTMVRRGLKVLLIDQFQLPHKRGSSGDASRIIRLYYEQAFYVAMAKEAYECWQELENISGEQLIQVTGALSVHQGERNLIRLKKAMKVMDEFGFPYEPMNASEMNNRFPMFQFDEGAKGMLDPNAGCLFATRCNRILLTEFLKLGGTLRDAEKVTDIIPGDVLTVKTSRGHHRSKNVALAPGPWAKGLLLSLGLDIPLKTLPAVPCYWKEKVVGSHSITAGMPIFVNNLDVKEGYQFIYGFPSLEYPGLVKVATRGEPAITPGGPEARDHDREGQARIINQLSAFIRRSLPGLDHESPAITEGCMYTKAPDGDFIIDRHPKYNNILFGGGGSGHAYKMAPVIGKMLTEMAMGSATSYDLTPFRLTRFNPAAKL